MTETIKQKLQSGNSIPVERVMVTAQEWAEADRERESLRLELEGCKQANEMLHQDKRELAAMVGRLREDIYAMADRIHGEWGTSKQTADDFLPDSYKETPPTALRHIRAEAPQPDDALTVTWMDGYHRGRSGKVGQHMPEGWIKCSERLPRIGERVILYSNGVVQHYMPFYDCDDSIAFWDHDGQIDTDPTVDFERDQWMPAALLTTPNSEGNQ